ncbi:MAG: HAD family hydrolase [Candidatus Hydrogenedentes bacterium]|nr:HAD family hydrolase [Candidatus Hydrogenedentota bacterium]
MDNAIAALQGHQPKYEFLIAIDSDGCAFDTMEVKHKECFIPNTIKFFGLQAISKYAREAAEFVNLYSKWRGVNRFPALVKTFDLLLEWDQAMARGVKIPAIPHLRQWIEEESKLGNPALEAYCKEHDHPDMHQTLAWSKAVNVSVDDIVQGGLPPFPFVRESLQKAFDRADLLVCSQTPQAALQREWEEQDLAHLVFTIAGQEQGKKGEHIAFASQGRYENTKILMIGDAPGDFKAAEANQAWFFPINPGAEDASWERLFYEGLDRFFDGKFGGAYQESLIEEFDSYLPATPRWKS